LSVLQAGDRGIKDDPWASVVARVVGVIFLVAGAAKFAAYGSELESFRGFGLPLAPVWVVAAGVIELVTGSLLLGRRAVVPAALLLVVTMAVAIAVSGIAHGDVVPSLTLAPALVVALLFVVRRALRP